ncbi:MAG: N-acyl homoserine lactonase family protein [Bryobacteraceae bacterium]
MERNASLVQHMRRGMERALLPLSALLLATAFVLMAQPAKAPAPKTLRLYVFDCGTLDFTEISNLRLTKEELATTKMSVECFLIAHPKGNMIWDTGAVPDTSFKSGSALGTLRYATALKPLKNQIAEAGYAPGDIKYLALSHFHWDHVGNANLFAGATWLTPKAERDIMFADPPSPRTEPANYIALRNSKTVFITHNDYDVFGDGSVVIKATPGHSPGHQVLYLNLRKTGPVVLSGDLYHYPEERKLKRIPVNEFNTEQTVASRAEIEAFLMKTGAQLWIQHDFIGSANLKKSPLFYE